MVLNLEENEEEVIKPITQTKSLTRKKNVKGDDLITVFSKFSDLNCTSKSSIVDEFEANEKIILDLESSLWDSKHKHCSFLWEDDSVDDARKYLSAVDKILEFVENRVLAKDSEFVNRVDRMVQIVMVRLENEFRNILVRSVVPLDGERICGLIRRVSSFVSNDGVSDDLEGSVDDDHESLREERRVSSGDELCLDLVSLDAVIDLREIAERMIRAGYEEECCQVYSSVRCDALFECLSILGVEGMSIEDVQKLEWSSLDDKMKKWIQTVKTVFRVLLPAEKQLCDQVFVCSEWIWRPRFIEIAKRCVMQLFNFAEAIVSLQRSSEKLFRILDMYDALDNVFLDLEALFSDNSGDFVYTEAKDILAGLGEAVKGTFVEFEKAVQSESSRKVTHGGEIHPLARYVMNYIKLLVDYSDSLNLLLRNSTDSSQHPVGDDGATFHFDSISPMGQRLLFLISFLESNLEDKSKLYEDGAMRYIFLMNNIQYIVQKVKNSELGKLLGDHWVRKRRSQVRQYATCYLRASWSKVLSFLKDEGLGNGSSNNVSKVALKERFKNFNAAFEEIYKTQSGWKVTDPQLRDELRISISERVSPAYRAFLGRFKSHLEGGRHASKYIKFTPEEIENHLLDLFEGSK
ncbi:Exocyst complex component exo70b1 [Thalictrum thalictroides]|uniref:Exocyst subunit Exo70 family protein n=1 Tax=Thalictrum thalictroides TaxID=46969 RepID=A0A7J6V479_THATH|nr:Exocyst complex component exo70b1 [Thalictrum thalictroides]